MKTKTLQAHLVTTIMLLGFLFSGNFATAQEKNPATLYIYGAVNTRDDKGTVFSPVVSVNVENNTLNVRSRLATQFQDYLKNYVSGEMGIDVRVDVTLSGPVDNRQKVEIDRQNWIKRTRETYKYNIIHTHNNFYFTFKE
ncbi:hypothetical protein EIB75_10070 [Epilithonimonas vandammei]|uniref:Uncharacterized protein n=1 Tax=Epilithonimonas vandammei TaxID=2487072 RepID=A0A3G8ZEF4_9FLAO|nr:hypothetical protein [Epilithonimonas vandammei]AZI55573.1 hypothetical protein EIB75_10070 [Epilithonimonas vandammei]